jgi:hypothetical protein
MKILVSITENGQKIQKVNSDQTEEVRKCAEVERDDRLDEGV